MSNQSIVDQIVADYPDEDDDDLVERCVDVLPNGISEETIIEMIMVASSKRHQNP